MRSRRVGARNSTTRTADQTAAAIFWVVQTGVPWHAAARAASAAKGLSVSENARLFALLALATADLQIVAMKEKYSRPHWRPLTAIRATAGNIPGLTGDPLWEPLLVTPPHPDYPSAHAVFSGAAETVLRVSSTATPSMSASPSRDLSALHGHIRLSRRSPRRWITRGCGAAFISAARISTAAKLAVRSEPW